MNSWKGITILAIIIIIFFVVAIFPNRITEEKAMERFVEITGTDDIEIIRHSNLSPVFGDTHDATFELKINGKHATGRCTSGIFSEMVCRIYYGEVDD